MSARPYIKTLNRRPRASIPIAYGPTSSASKAVSSLKGLLSGDLYDIPYELSREPGIVDTIGEFISKKFPGQNINASDVANLASKLKVPLVAAVGIAAAAGLTYLVYKMYKNRATISETASKFLSDVKATAPDLSRVPGWLDSIKHEVGEALRSDNPASIVERLVGIKNAVLGHQNTIAPAGAGIDFFIDMEPRYRTPRPDIHIGGGLKVPI